MGTVAGQEEAEAYRERRRGGEEGRHRRASYSVAASARGLPDPRSEERVLRSDLPGAAFKLTVYVSFIFFIAFSLRQLIAEDVSFENVNQCVLATMLDLFLQTIPKYIHTFVCA